MKKMPIELLTTKTASAQNGCPIIWDGNNVILATAPELNLLSIVRTLSSVSRLTADLTSRVETNYTTLSRLAPVVESLNTFIPTIAQRMNSIEQIMSSESGVSVRLATVEERTNSIEQNINVIIQGGSGSGGGGSGGGALTSSWAAILTSLESGNFIYGESGVSVEKVSGNYKIKLTKPNTTVTITSTSDLIKVLTKADGSINIGFDPSKLANYISAGAGLSLDTRNPERLTIKPAATLITGDNTTTKVTYNELSGQFKIEVIEAPSGSGSGGGSGGGTTTTAIDGTTITLNPSKALQVNTAILVSPIVEMNYKSTNYDNAVVHTPLTRYTKYTDASFTAFTEILSKSYNAFVSDSMRGALLEIRAGNIWAGNNYILKTDTSEPSLHHNSFTGLIGDVNSWKNARFDINCSVRMMANDTNSHFATIFPLNLKTLSLPFILYYLENMSTGKVCWVGGDFLRFGEISGNGSGCEFNYRQTKVINSSILKSYNLASGQYRVRHHVGIKVAHTAESLFHSAFIGKFSVELISNSVLSLT